MSRLAPDERYARFIRRTVLVILIRAIAAALYRAGDLLILAFGSALGARAAGGPVGVHPLCRADRGDAAGAWARGDGG
ncbi:MAG TPA: hypothetical protein VFQ57_03675 [Sphingomonas sp.]|jgi:hypothetical protein|nr:hypothetical protein [Sphingomonas sp.]